MIDLDDMIDLGEFLESLENGTRADFWDAFLILAAKTFDLVEWGPVQNEADGTSFSMATLSAKGRAVLEALRNDERCRALHSVIHLRRTPSGELLIADWVKGTAVRVAKGSTIGEVADAILATKAEKEQTDAKA
jgi:hypothetical protein